MSMTRIDALLQAAHEMFDPPYTCAHCYRPVDPEKHHVWRADVNERWHLRCADAEHPEWDVGWMIDAYPAS